MTMHAGRTLCALAAFAIGATLTTSANAFIFWTDTGDGVGNRSGMNMDFTGGGSDFGLFGDPTVVGGNTLVFFPSSFRAESSDGTPGDENDRLEVTIIAHAGFKIDQIQISEFGDYAINGGGEVSVTGTMFVTDLINTLPGPFPLPRVETDDLVSSPGSPITSAGTTSGSWTATAGIDLTSTGGPDWTMVKLVLNNNLFALSDAGGNSFIEKKVAGTGIAITVIPTPGAGALLAIGGLAFVRRRR
ncbi:MAG: MprA protease, GlyGly-CTERM protein-sorting domain-containing form [Phycisphaerales bacterium JB043]